MTGLSGVIAIARSVSDDLPSLAMTTMVRPSTFLPQVTPFCRRFPSAKVPRRFDPSDRSLRGRTL
jgi:hypothetical protein